MPTRDYSLLPSYDKVNLPPRPYFGWLKTARQALGLTLKQVGSLLGKSPQSVRDAERREVDGTISLRRLREIAGAMDLEVVYALRPKHATIDATVRARALEKARLLLADVHQQMVLEAQTNDNVNTEEEIEAIAEMLLRENPDYIWT